MRITKEHDNPEGTTIGMPKAVKAYWTLKEIEDMMDAYGIKDLKELHQILYCAWRIQHLDEVLGRKFEK